ncbi:MAG: protein kinase domain-containing protein, partial [Planctomycetota bacterium]
MDLADETLRPGDDPLIGSVIAGFQVIKKLGEGAMGVVYLAKQVSLDRNIALKILPPNPALLQGDTISRFMREARTAASLSHINIVQVHDAGEYEGLYFIAMEYVSGLGLSDVLKGLNCLTEPAGLEIALQTAQGLGAAADRGVIHRDIKPANLMITQDAVVKVADFGLAKSVDQGAAGLTATGKIVGTPSYMSPEQVESRPTDLRSDIFSLGVTLFESVTGSKPFLADSIVGVLRQVVDKPAPDPRSIREDLSEDTARIVLRMVEKEPHDRYQSYPDLIQDLLMAKRSLTKPPGYLDSIKVFIQNDLASRVEEQELVTMPVKSTLKTIKLSPGGGLTGTQPQTAAPPAGRSLPRPIATAPQKSSKPLVLGATAGILLCTAAFAAIFFYYWQKGTAEGSGTVLAPVTTFNLEIRAPAEGAVVKPGILTIEGRFSGKTPDSITIGGKAAFIGEGEFNGQVTLKHGKASIPIIAETQDGVRETKNVTIHVDDKPPLIEFEKRVIDGKFVTRDENFGFSGRLVDDFPHEVVVKGTPLPLRSGGRFRFTASIPGEGSRVYLFEGQDKAGNAVQQSVEVVRDSSPPVMRFENIDAIHMSSLPAFEFTIFVNEPLHRLQANKSEVEIQTKEAGVHTVSIMLTKPGINPITVVGEDFAGNITRLHGEVTFHDLRTEEGKEQEGREHKDLQISLEGLTPGDQIPLLEEFLKRFPESKHAQKIRKRIEKLSKFAEEEAWDDIRNATDEDLETRIRVLQAYIDRF